MLDLAQFDSFDDAIAKIAPGDRYLEIGKLVVPISSALPLTLATLFWFSMITRSEGLHSAVAREIAESNPHAVFPLLRAFSESVVLAIYVNDHPAYVNALTSRPKEQPKGAPARKSIQALISYASSHAPGMKLVYSELSEATHFGSTAMWAAHSIEGDEESMTTSWTSYPRWRSEDQALIACAQILELAEAMDYYLREFFERHVEPLATR
jgi:hypothetical protein